ncbi:MAG: hypothetical protein ACJ78V_07460 [Myxococcales bacterium]
MNYLVLAKQIGLDRVVAFFVRVAGAVAEAVIKLVAERKRQRRRDAEALEPLEAAIEPQEEVRVDVTVVSISTETITVSSARCHEEER